MILTTTDRTKLIHAFTQYDIRASKRKYYNPYALGQYFMAVDRMELAMVEAENAGKPLSLRAALLKHFNDRLLSCALKAVGEKGFTMEELRSQQIII